VGIVAVVAWKPFPSNLPLVEGWRRLGIRAELVRPPDASRRLGAGDVALLRLDVSPTLDGVEPGLGEIAALRRRGVRLLNPPAALLAAHDKRETALRLENAGIPHPRTRHRYRLDEVRAFELPAVLKPRFATASARHAAAGSRQPTAQRTAARQTPLADRVALTSGGQVAGEPRDREVGHPSRRHQAHGPPRWPPDRLAPRS